MVGTSCAAEVFVVAPDWLWFPLNIVVTPGVKDSKHFRSPRAP